MERISNYVGALCRTLVNVKKKKTKKTDNLLPVNNWRFDEKPITSLMLLCQSNATKPYFFFYLQKGNWKVCISRTVHLRECLLAESWLQWTQQEKTTKLTWKRIFPRSESSAETSHQWLFYYNLWNQINIALKYLFIHIFDIVFLQETRVHLFLFICEA